ncbi:MAG: endonuclease/exonuclease/phosphatase family protein [Anaerolineae bacterium]
MMTHAPLSPPQRVLRVLLSALCTTALLACAASPPPGETVRVATLNIAMGLDNEGELAARLAAGDDPALQDLAAVLQTVRPDIVLLNEVDFQPGVDAAGLLRRHYLQIPREGRQAIDYPYSFSAPVNTGVPSGLDIDGNGTVGGPGDAWGFGRFPGQYGMLVLSKYPLQTNQLRSFQLFPWSAMPGAQRPRQPDGSAFYPDEVWSRLRLSSKNHWDLPVRLPGGQVVHLLISHPTPPVFDGPEDRNGRRNHDEIRLWLDYVSPDPAGAYLVDDQGRSGGLPPGARWLVMGDLNADPVDGDGRPGPIRALLDPALSNQDCVPASEGAVEAARLQGGVNSQQQGDPALDTSDFNDRNSGNMRVDFVLPSRSLAVTGCGVFWPAAGQPGHQWLGFTDHRLVWVDIAP